jgi:hypothetical protein
MKINKHNIVINNYTTPLRGFKFIERFPKQALFTNTKYDFKRTNEKTIQMLKKLNQSDIQQVLLKNFIMGAFLTESARMYNKYNKTDLVNYTNLLLEIIEQAVSVRVTEFSAMLNTKSALNLNRQLPKPIRTDYHRSGIEHNKISHLNKLVFSFTQNPMNNDNQDKKKMYSCDTQQKNMIHFPKSLDSHPTQIIFDTGNALTTIISPTVVKYLGLTEILAKEKLTCTGVIEDACVEMTHYVTLEFKIIDEDVKNDLCFKCIAYVDKTKLQPYILFGQKGMHGKPGCLKELWDNNYVINRHVD